MSSTSKYDVSNRIRVKLINHVIEDIQELLKINEKIDIHERLVELDKPYEEFLRDILVEAYDIRKEYNPCRKSCMGKTFR